MQVLNIIIWDIILNSWLKWPLNRASSYGQVAKRMARQLKIPGSHLFPLSQGYLSVKWNYWLALTETWQLPKKNKQKQKHDVVPRYFQYRCDCMAWRWSTGLVSWHNTMASVLFQTCLMSNPKLNGTVELVSNTFKKRLWSENNMGWHFVYLLLAS